MALTLKTMLFVAILTGMALHYAFSQHSSLRSRVGGLNNERFPSDNAQPKGLPPKRRTLGANGDPAWEDVSCGGKGGKGGKGGGRRKRKLEDDSVENGNWDSAECNGGSPDGASLDGEGPDGGNEDGGSPDGGSPDGGSQDGGSPDGGIPDGGNQDGGSPDGGSPDGRSQDGGSQDGGSPDGGSADGGDSGGEASPSNEGEDIEDMPDDDGGGMDGGNGGGGGDAADGGQASPSNEGEDINDPQEISPSNEEDEVEAGGQGSPGITLGLDNLDDLDGGSHTITSSTTAARPTHEESPSNDDW